MRITITFFLLIAINAMSWGQTEQEMLKHPNNKSSYDGKFNFTYNEEVYQIEFKSAESTFTITKNGITNCSGEFIKTGDSVFQLTPTQTSQEAVLNAIIRFKTSFISENDFTVEIQEQFSETTQSLILTKQ